MTRNATLLTRSGPITVRRSKVDATVRVEIDGATIAILTPGEAVAVAIMLRNAAARAGR